MRTVLFVPGFQEDMTSRDYAKTIAAIKAAGYKVKFVPIRWTRTTIVDWAKELHEVYDTHDPGETILAGFSFGAMTAFRVAVDRPPAELWLFSLSPYFKEDQADPSFKKSWLTQIGHRRADTFNALSFKSLVKKIGSKIFFFYGDEELKSWTDISIRHAATRSMSNVQTVMIAGAKHDVTQPEYIQAISAEIR